MTQVTAFHISPSYSRIRFNMSELIDNRAQRVRALKTIIKALHAGAPQDEVGKASKTWFARSTTRKSWKWSSN